MSTIKSEQSEAKAQMAEKLGEFLRMSKLEKSKGWLAKQIGAGGTQNINDWLESGAIPAYILLNIVQEFPEAREVFGIQPIHISEGAGIVAETKSPWYSDPTRRQLIDKVKRLVAAADDRAIKTLIEVVDLSLENADVKREYADVKREYEELKKKMGGER